MAWRFQHVEVGKRGRAQPHVRRGGGGTKRGRVTQQRKLTGSAQWGAERADAARHAIWESEKVHEPRVRAIIIRIHGRRRAAVGRRAVRRRAVRHRAHCSMRHCMCTPGWVQRPHGLIQTEAARVRVLDPQRRPPAGGPRRAVHGTKRGELGARAGAQRVQRRQQQLGGRQRLESRPQLRPSRAVVGALLKLLDADAPGAHIDRDDAEQRAAARRAAARRAAASRLVDAHQQM